MDKLVPLADLPALRARATAEGRVSDVHV